jgi:hypothetical protein
MVLGVCAREIVFIAYLRPCDLPSQPMCSGIHPGIKGSVVCAHLCAERDTALAQKCIL